MYPNPWLKLFQDQFVEDVTSPQAEPKILWLILYIVPTTGHIGTAAIGNSCATDTTSGKSSPWHQFLCVIRLCFYVCVSD